MSEFDQIIRGLERMRDLAWQGAVEGLTKGAEAMEGDAQATDSYKGVTGATRAGTVAYVVGGGADQGDRLGQALEAVEDKNPGRGQLQQVGTVGDDEIAVVLTVPSDYVDIIEENVGAAQAFLGPTLEAHAERLAAAAARGIAEKLR
jgi:hypothetical protein